MTGRYVPTLAQFGCMKEEVKRFEVTFLDRKVLDLKQQKNRAVELRKMAEEGKIQAKDISHIMSFATDCAEMFDQEIKTLSKKLRIL